MKHLAFALTMSAVILAAQSAPAQAPGNGGGTLDHLVCYKMKDPLMLQTSADMLAELQPEFTQKGCILVKPIEFCVPASKRNVSPAPLNPNIIGQPLKNDYICYQAKCKSPVPPPDKEVIDQFGERLEQGFKVAKVCVPAQKRPPGCGLVGGKGPCLGACPVDAAGVQQVCELSGTGAAKTCGCVTPVSPKPCGGKPDAAGLCTGDCSTPGDLCVLSKITNPTGKAVVTCNCQPPPSACGLDPATGACGGKCQKATDQCVFNSAGRCTCEPAPSPCQSITNGPVPCGGACPLDTQTCKPVPGSCVAGKCAGTGTACTSDANCNPCTCDPPAACSRNALTGACGGDCPTGTLCSLDTTGHNCDCFPTPCGSVGTTAGAACSGACQNGEKCAADATGACNCQPPTNDPCASQPCNPACLPGQSCGIVAGTNVCRCQ